MRELQEICFSICDVEGGLMEGTISFHFDKLMMAMKAPHPCEILDNILSGIYWTVRSGKKPEKEQLAKTIKELESFKKEFKVKELGPLIKELKEHLESYDKTEETEIDDAEIDALIESEEFQKRTDGKVYYIEGVYVTFIDGEMGEDSMDLTPDEILSPLSAEEAAELEKVMEKYGVPDYDFFEGLEEYSDDEEAYDLYDDDDATAIIDGIIEAIENGEFPYDSIADFAAQLMRNSCKDGEYNYIFEGELYSLYDSLDREPRGSFLEFTNEEWMEVLNNIEQYEI